MRVLIINTSERIGGAAIAASRLMEALKKSGVKARMLVRDKQTDRLTVAKVEPSWLLPLKFVWERLVIFLANGFSRRKLFQVDIANAGTDVTGMTEFEQADVVHLHWVNQGFLSLGDIEKIMHSGKKVVVTMHDMWYFTGVCHYASECGKYKTGCSDCPLMRGGVLGDVAKRVYEAKRSIYNDAKVTFVGCSRWIADLARQSALTAGKRVVNIPNAIDVSLFCPGDKAEARRELGLPSGRKLLLFGCQRITNDIKGFRYMAEALSIIGQRNEALARELLLVVVGGDSDKVRDAVQLDVKTISYVSDVKTIIALNRAVDVYVTPSLQDNLPNTIVEAMACGTPCVGFDIGGIPEMIDHKQNGYVAEYKNASDLADGIMWTLAADYDSLSENARKIAVERYGEESVARKYIEVYEN